VILLFKSGSSPFDVAEVWYLHFIHEFLFKCLDIEGFHFYEGDTDSAYFAVAGDPNESCEQVFSYYLRQGVI